jgi:hypothetical protein
MAEEGGAGQFNIFVKSINGKTRSLTVTAGTTIADMKAQIAEKEGVSAEEQRLIYAGKNLEDTKTVADYNLGVDSTVHLVLRVRGGANQAKVETPQLQFDVFLNWAILTAMKKNYLPW